VGIAVGLAGEGVPEGFDVGIGISTRGVEVGNVVGDGSRRVTTGAMAVASTSAASMVCPIQVKARARATRIKIPTKIVIRCVFFGLI
jgi:hypothetical protein